MNRYRLAGVVGLCGLAWAAGGADPAKPPGKAAPGDTELVERALASRKEYQQSLIALYDHYLKAGDRERAKWAQEELMSFHLAPKPSYRLDIQDVPPPTLEAKANIKEANDLYRDALSYKGKGFGTEYQLNQRRAELRLHEVLTKYPTCDKIADVAYQLGDLYENRPYRQYDRAAAYFERSHQWKKGTQSDALLRAARLYDRQLNERARAIDIYREIVATDTDATRLQEAERRLAELTGNRK